MLIEDDMDLLVFCPHTHRKGCQNSTALGFEAQQVLILFGSFTNSSRMDRLLQVLATALPFLFLLGICCSYFLYLVSGSERDRP
jgi:hypothetical protein